MGVDNILKFHANTIWLFAIIWRTMETAPLVTGQISSSFSKERKHWWKGWPGSSAGVFFAKPISTQNQAVAATVHPTDMGGKYFERSSWAIRNISDIVDAACLASSLICLPESLHLAGPGIVALRRLAGGIMLLAPLLEAVLEPCGRHAWPSWEFDPNHRPDNPSGSNYLACYHQLLSSSSSWQMQSPSKLRWFLGT